MVVHFGDRDIFNQKEGELMAKEINWNVVLVVLVIGVVGILLLSNSGILTGAVIDATNSAGTTGKIAKWTSSSKLGNYVITESTNPAGKIGIGVTPSSPYDNKLEVYDSIGITSTDATVPIRAQLSQDSGTLYLGENIYYSGGEWKRFDMNKKGSQIRLTALDVSDSSYSSDIFAIYAWWWDPTLSQLTMSEHKIFSIDQFSSQVNVNSLNIKFDLVVDGWLTVGGRTVFEAPTLYFTGVEDKNGNSAAKYLCIDSNNLVFKSPNPCKTL